MFKKLLTGLAALAVAVMPTVAHADAYRQVRVENHSNSSYIVYVHIQNEHGRIYDALDGLYIIPGYNRVLSFDDGEGHDHCWQVVEAEFDNGVTARRYMDTCSVRVWRIYDIDNTIHY